MMMFESCTCESDAANPVTLPVVLTVNEKSGFPDRQNDAPQTTTSPAVKERPLHKIRPLPSPTYPSQPRRRPYQQNSNVELDSVDDWTLNLQTAS